MKFGIFDIWRKLYEDALFDIWQKLYEDAYLLIVDPFVDDADVFFDTLEVNLIHETRHYRK